MPFKSKTDSAEPVGTGDAPKINPGDLAPLRTESSKNHLVDGFDPTDAKAFGELIASRERTEPGADATSLTRDEMEAYGINPDTHVPYRVRNPRLWEDTEKKDRLAEFLKIPGREPCTDKNGNFIYEADTVLCKISRAELEWINQQQERENAEDRDRASQGHIPQAEAWGDEPSRVMASAAHRQHVADGTIGPSQGRDYPDVIAERAKKFGEASIEEEQRRWAGIDRMPKREYESREEFDAANKDASKGKKTFAMGATIKDGKVVR